MSLRWGPLRRASDTRDSTRILSDFQAVEDVGDMVYRTIHAISHALDSTRKRANVRSVSEPFARSYRCTWAGDRIKALIQIRDPFMQVRYRAIKALHLIFNGRKPAVRFG